ncbi:MAG TPA: NAD-dependent epimerase/dehydratase family protein [Luteimonas sp.]|nr:NAD-dependent epimerase/dehydratase family protein [Luteimonas sp.]
MRTALVFGGSGQIGLPLLDLLHDDGWRVIAVSRDARSDQPGLQWLKGDLSDTPGLPRHADAVFSCGPLDLFSQWYARTSLETPRVVAFGSTSVEVKRGSSDPAERETAARLREAERLLFDTAQARGAGASVLRPTLVYGAGRDMTLSRIAHTAQRFGRFALPRGAVGLRQPVHVDDLAAAAFAAVDVPITHGQAYALPGGETLTYREMVRRMLAVLRPPPRLYELPSPLFNLLLAAAHAAGHARGFGEAAVARMRSDLAFDAGPAQRDFGYAPRPFRPTAQMFASREP